MSNLLSEISEVLADTVAKRHLGTTTLMPMVERLITAIRFGWGNILLETSRPTQIFQPMSAF